MAYMQRQIQQRTERLNIMGDSMDRLEETSSSWAEDVNKFVSNQKKKAVMGCKGFLPAHLDGYLTRNNSHWEQVWVVITHGTTYM